MAAINVVPATRPGLGQPTFYPLRYSFSPPLRERRRLLRPSSLMGFGQAPTAGAIVIGSTLATAGAIVGGALGAAIGGRGRSPWIGLGIAALVGFLFSGSVGFTKGLVAGLGGTSLLFIVGRPARPLAGRRRR